MSSTPSSPPERADPAAPARPAGRYRWVICALLFFAISILYVDRQILALLKPLLDGEMGWTDQQFGWINGVFFGAYGLSALAAGWLVDRFGAKAGFAVTMAAWSLSALFTSTVGSVRGFLFARLAVGASEGGCFPVAIKTAAVWFPQTERALATSIFNSGANGGAILAPAIIPLIAFHWGWRGAYVAATGAGLLWLIAWLVFFQPPETSSRVGAAERAYILAGRDAADRETIRIPWARLLGRREAWSFIVAKFMTDPIWWFFLIWLPDFFKKSRGLDLKHSWVHLVGIYAIVTVLSIAGGWVTGHLLRRGWSVTRARKTGMLLFALCVLPIVTVTHLGNGWVVLLIGLAGAAHQAWSATLYTTVSDMFPQSAVASVIGVGGLAGALGGMLFQPFTGGLLDFFRSRGGATAGYNVLFWICGCAYLAAFILHHLCAPRLEKIDPAAIRPSRPEPARA